ncbi:beta strand repeat-containing protein [Sphingobium sp. B11D3A]|uniref:beta strand repeat-containing protein n=1 Tax=Sphingobium sp. B11D3A TaxID=2940574 RepID=UPI0022241618|nr:calcium-binding protein [Sphingobium sp. B11D3A]MCW2393507.1 Ca2+-binding RTX toxin-like protein [Sphingobium sp. B11D3A]
MPQDPNADYELPIWGEVGDALKGIGEYLSLSPHPEIRNWGRYCEAVGDSISSSDQAADAAIAYGTGSKSALEIAGGIAGGLLGAAIPAAALNTLLGAGAFTLLIGEAPLIVGIGVVVAVSWGLSWAFSEMGEAVGKWLNDSLNDLLNNLMSDPLVLDLDGDGLELTSLGSSTTMFDIDDDGSLEHVGWVNAHDGLLVYDANQNGIADGVGELFGSAHVDGFDELKTINANGDNKIDALDPAFANLLVWKDINADGVSTAGEMLTMAQAGIASLNLSYSTSGTTVGGNKIARLGSYTRTVGGQRQMGSIWFGIDETTQRPTVPANADLTDLNALPNLGASGAVPSLRSAMYIDPLLKEMVDNLVTDAHEFETFKDFCEGGFLDVIYRWAGVDPDTPGATTQSLHEAVIKAFTGRPLQDLNGHQKERVNEVWDSLVGQLGAAFLVQASAYASTQPWLAFSEAVGALDVDDPAFASNVEGLVDNAITQNSNAVPAYAYLKKYSGLQFDTTTGEITGDFDAFAAEFIKNQPSIMTLFSSGSAPRPLDTSGMVPLSIVIDGNNDGLEDEPEENLHPWTKWYNDQGKELFYIAQAMGLGSDYVLNVTGWRWLTSSAADVKGTEGNDVLSEVVSTYAISLVTATSDGGSSRQNQTKTTRDQRLYGFAGADELRGNDGADRLVGGTGNDLLLGGSGSDMYLYAAGDGLDRITEESGSDDTIYFSSELHSSALKVERFGTTYDLLIHFGNTSEGIILTNQINMGNSAVEHFNFSGETPLDAGDIATIYLRTLSTENADTFTGTKAGERMYGLGGNDTLSGWDGNDQIFGGDGNDILRGDNGNDELNGGEGNDDLNGGEGSDVLIGGHGNDTFSEVGLNGDDTYVWNLGDGDDVITGGNWNDGYNTIRFGAGITAGDLRYAYANGGAGLTISVANQPGSITIWNQLSRGADELIDRIQLADGTVLSRAMFEHAATSQLATPGNDTLWGSELGQTIDGGDGDDTINARGGNDIIIGGRGNDTFSEGGSNGDDTYVWNLGDGDDVISGGDWNDGYNTIQFGAGITAGDLRYAYANGGAGLTISVANQPGSITIWNQLSRGADELIDRIQLADGTVLSRAMFEHAATSQLATPGNDTLWGSELGQTIDGGDGDDTINARGGNDIIIGGRGNDTFSEGGSNGDDTYVWNLGDGDDVISGGDWNDGYNTIQFGAGITAGDLRYAYANGGASLTISVADQPGSITILNQLSRDPDELIDRIQFADGTALSRAMFEQAAVSQLATSGNDVLWGSALSQTIDGGEGDDTIYARGGNDIIKVGYNAGHDSVDGGAGTDTIQALYDGTIIGLSYIAGVETITADGHSGVYIQGSTNADVLNFGGINLIAIEKIDGGAGNDTVSGSAGSDIIWGGAGNDILKGNAGDDLFCVTGSGDGFDSVDGGTGNDIIAAQAHNTVIGLSSITAVETISANGFANVVIAGSGNADTLNFSSVILSGITSIDGGNGNDVITGSASEDIMIGSGGDDVLSGNDGNDFFQYAGNLNGFDTVDGGNGLDIVSALADDTVIGLKTFANLEMITGGAFQNVTIAGSSIADIWNFGALTLSGIAKIDGGLGNDSITGSAGSDTLRGSEGDDVLSGGDGDDIFQYTGATGGFDMVDGGIGNDSLQALASGTTIGLKSLTGIESINANGFTGVTIMGSSVADTLDFTAVALNGIVSIDGGAGNDAITGSSGNDVILGSAGNDILSGGDGDDLISGGAGNDVIDGGNGTDTANYSTNTATQTINLALTGAQTISSGDIDTILNVENVIGGSGADTIAGNAAANVLEGRAGNDTINGGAGDDSLFGGDGNDTLIGGADNDIIDGGNGIDTISYASNSVAQSINLSITTAQTISVGDIDTILNIENVVGGTGADVIIGDGMANSLDGGAGNDTISGAGGNDTLLGNDGDDLLVGGAGNDVINGGSGVDTVDYSYATSAQSINLSTTTAQTISSGDVDTISNVENVIGGSGSDTITGSSGDNILDGGDGDDRLKGGTGNDTIIGGTGTNDVAIFAGTQASYTISTVNGAITITDNQPSVDGNDGVDTVSGIENIEFKGGIRIGISSPIVLDLDGDGVELVSLNASKTKFDWEGDGKSNRTGWVGKDDGLLVYDRNHDGKVTDAEELSFVNDKPGAKSDLDGLSSFDTNNDGMFSNADEAFGDFRIWRDKNSNGRSDSGELLSLADAGVASITLAGEAVNKTWDWSDNITINTGMFTKTDGSTAALSDVALNYSTQKPSSRSAGGGRREQSVTETARAANQLAEAIAAFAGNEGGDTLMVHDLMDRKDAIFAVVSRSVF